MRRVTLRLVLAWKIRICIPNERAAVATSRSVVSVLAAFAGLTSPAITQEFPSYRQLHDMQRGNRNGAWTPLMASVVAHLGPDS